MLPAPAARVSARTYPPELDSSTHPTRARRAIADLLAGESRRVHGPERVFPGSHLLPTPWAGHAGGSGRAGAHVLVALDGIVGDLVEPFPGPVPGPHASPARSIDVAEVHPDLAAALSTIRKARDAGDIPTAQRGLAEAVRLMARRVLQDRGPLRADALALAARAGIDGPRAEHLAGLMPTPALGGWAPAGTLAHAYGTLEAIAYRLAARGALGPAPLPCDHVARAMSGFCRA